MYTQNRIYNSGRAVHFTWNADKGARNKAKHGLDFSFAEIVFSDALHVVVYDRHEGGEERWHGIGAVAGSLQILLVVHCYPDPGDPELVRIVGLRKATTFERRRYEDGE